MKLIIKKIRWRNFLSTGNQWTEIILDSHATTLIIGKNGSGKTTFLDALSFLLFNKSFRNINKPQLVNTITDKDCMVEGEFEINGHEFFLKRGVKPVIFEIWKNNKLVTQVADNRDYQQALEKHVLRCNYRTFCQIVMLGSAIFQPFMALPAPSRREVIEDLLDLKIFTRMNMLLKDKVSKLDYENGKNHIEKMILEDRLKLTTQHFEEIKAQNERVIAEKQARIEEYGVAIGKDTNEILLLKLSLEKLRAKQIKESELKLDSLIEFQTQLVMKCDQFQNEIFFFKNNDICPTCNQDIVHEFKCQAIDSRLLKQREIDFGLEKLKKKIAKVQEKRAKFTELGSQINSIVTSIEFYKRQISFHISSISNLEREILLLNLEMENYVKKSVDLDELNQQLIKLDAKITNINEDLNVMGYAASLLKDSGIKSQFIKTYIPVINSLIQKHLTDLDFFIEFQLDENFQETIRSRFRDEFSYESFSEGEKVRLNIAILMTWRTIAKMRGSIDCNLLIFDELFDGSLDPEGLEEVMKLLNNLTSNENVFIISHKEDQLLDKFDRVIKFEKIRNFSRIIT